MTPEQKKNVALFVNRINVKPKDRAEFLARDAELKGKGRDYRVAKAANVPSKTPKPPKAPK